MSHLPCRADADVALICDIAGRVSMCQCANVGATATTPATSAARAELCGRQVKEKKTRTPASKSAVPSRTFLSSVHQQQSVIHNLADFTRYKNNQQEEKKCQKEEKEMSAEHQMAR